MTRGLKLWRVKQPISGIAGTKPQVSKAKPDGQRVEGGIARPGCEYRIGRNETLRLKNMQAQMLLARARGELIERLVEHQAAYLLTVLGQRILAVPAAYGPRLAGMADAHAAATILRELALALLGELMDLPARVTDPNWLESLGENGEKPPAPKAKTKARKR